MDPRTTTTRGAQLQAAPQKLGSPPIAPEVWASLRHRPQSMAACRTVSLPTNPNSGGTPAMDSDEIAATQNSAGWDFRRPESLLRSRVPVILSIAPTTIKSGALNSECESNMARPAMAPLTVPKPLAIIRKPSCETVP